MRKKPPPIPKKRNRASVYPWEKWFSQKVTKLVQGKHFYVSPAILVQQLRNWRRAKGWDVGRVETVTNGISVTIKVEKPRPLPK